MTEHPLSFDRSLADASETLARRLRAILVTVRSGAGGGSGTVWKRDGVIVTNNHVVPGDRATVALADGRELEARVTARDPDSDLALLHVDAVLSEVAEARDAATLRAGELVFAIGNPWGEAGVLTRGVVLSRGRPNADGRAPFASAIRADLRLAPGNSGGPLADAAGRVVGINSMIAGGLAVAIPSGAVALVAAQDSPGFLGISGRAVPLPQAIAASYSDADGGILITNVVDGSAAEAAGLIPGDLLVGLAGSTGLESLARQIRRLRAGQPLAIDVIRAGRLHSTHASPAARH